MSFVLVASPFAYCFFLFKVTDQRHSVVSLYVSPHVFFHFAIFFLAFWLSAQMPFWPFQQANYPCWSPGVCPKRSLCLFKHTWAQRGGFFSLLAAGKHKGFPGQGSDLSCSCDLWPQLRQCQILKPLCQASVCNLHHSSWQHRILNPLNETRDQTCLLVDASQIHFHCAPGTPRH